MTEALVLNGLHMKIGEQGDGGEYFFQTKVLLHNFNKVRRQGKVWREPGEELDPDCVAVTVRHSPSKMF